MGRLFYGVTKKAEKKGKCPLQLLLSLTSDLIT